MTDKFAPGNDDAYHVVRWRESFFTCTEDKGSPRLYIGMERVTGPLEGVDTTGLDVQKVLEQIYDIIGGGLVNRLSIQI